MSSLLYDKLLTDISAVTNTRDKMDYQALGAAQHRKLLKRTGVGILYLILMDTDLDESRPITVIGPSTLGALMVDELSKIPELEPYMSFRALLRVRRQDQYAWNQSPNGVINHETQVIWINDMITTGFTLEQTRPLIEAAGGSIHSVGVIGNNCSFSADDLEVGHLVALQTNIQAVIAPGTYDHSRPYHPSTT